MKQLLHRTSMLCRHRAGTECSPNIGRRQSAYLWETDDGIVHQIEQGEGSEQGDPLTPFVCPGTTRKFVRD